MRKTEIQLPTLFHIEPKILTVNRRFLALTGSEDLLDFNVKNKCLSELFTAREGYIDPVINGTNWISHVANNPEQLHKALITISEIEYTFLVHAARYSLDNNYRYIVVLEDISELERHAQTDYLTQLYTRHKVHEIMKLNLDQFERYGQVFSIIMLDIDNFKRINDSFGHQVGDSVLTQIASIIQCNTRLTDTVGRWGGEEFLIVCPNTDMESAYQAAETIRNAIESCHFDKTGNTTVSLGINSIQYGMSIEQLITGADQALYYGYIQVVSATVLISQNTSLGVLNPKHFLGRLSEFFKVVVR